jgi:hypothetical protein
MPKDLYVVELRDIFPYFQYGIEKRNNPDEEEEDDDEEFPNANGRNDEDDDPVMRKYTPQLQKVPDTQNLFQFDFRGQGHG